MAKHCCDVFADGNAIYFTALCWIINDWDWFETLKTNFRENEFEYYFYYENKLNTHLYYL